MNAEDKLNLIKNLSEEKRLAFYRKLQQRLAQNSDLTQQIRKYERDDRIPLSAIQEQIWFYEQITENSNAYNVPMAMHLIGQIDLGILTKVLNNLVCRHEILRVYFATVEGKPFQFIQDELDVNIEIIDIQNANVVDKVEYGKEIAAKLSREHFDLSQSPLFRVSLINIEENNNILVFVIHHLLCDNWSLRLLINEVITLYTAYVNNQPIQLKTPQIQYVDYCYWEQELLGSEQFEKQTEFLKKKLQGKINQLELPFDRKRVNWDNREAKSQRFYLNPTQFIKIKEFCKENSLTTFIVLFSIFNALLYRYTKANDIIVGTSFINRPNVDSEFVLGPFINILIICTSFDRENLTFRQLMNEVKENILSYHAYKHVPMYKIIKELKIRRNVNTLSLFQVFFDFLNFNMEEWNVEAPSGIDVDFMIQYDILVHHNTPKFDIDLTMAETEKDIGGNIEYACDVFNDQTILQIIEHFLLFVDSFLEDPDEQIINVPLFEQQNDQYEKLLNLTAFSF